jgi:hypothetical protein
VTAFGIWDLFTYAYVWVLQYVIIIIIIIIIIINPLKRSGYHTYYFL